MTADPLSMQKNIIDSIMGKGADFLIELNANQCVECYGVNDRLKEHTPLYSYLNGSEFIHVRIKTITDNRYCGLIVIANQVILGGNMTIVEYKSDIIKKIYMNIYLSLRKTAVSEQYGNGYTFLLYLCTITGRLKSRTCRGLCGGMWLPGGDVCANVAVKLA